MVFWIRSVILVVVLHGCVASRYYYKEKNGNYDVYYGPNAQWGYKEIRPPKSYKISHGDRGDRPGKCVQGEFNCDSPYPVTKTKFFECDADYQCPRFFKCCKNICFQHRICQPIDLDASEDNEIPTDGSITETTSEVTITMGSSSTIQSSTHSSTDGSLPSKGTEETTQNTQSTQYTEKSTIGGTDNTQSTSTFLSPSTPGKITHTEQESTTVIISSSSIFPSATTSEAPQPSTSHSTQFTTTERTAPTTVTHISSDMSTISSTIVDVTSTTEQSTTIGNEYIQSTSPVSIQSSTYSKEPSTTVTVSHSSSVTFPFVSTSKDTQSPTQHSSKFTTRKGIETTTVSYVPTHIFTVSSTMREDTTTTQEKTSTQHMTESTAMRNTDTESTTTASTGYSTISDRITHADGWNSSPTTFPSTITSTVTQSSSRQTTKLSTTERTETTVATSTTTPYSSHQENGKPEAKSTEYIYESTTTVDGAYMQTSTTETPTIETPTTPFKTTTKEKVSSTATIATYHPLYTTTSEVTPSTSHNVTITHLPSSVFITPTVTDIQEDITTQRETSSSQQTSTSQKIEDETTKHKQTYVKSTGTTQISEITTNTVYSTITQVPSTTEGTLLTTISADVGKDTSGTVSPSYSTISSSETQPPTLSVKYETTESSTESITVKQTTKLLTDTTLTLTTHPTAPESTTSPEMSSNTITSSSKVSDETKSNTKYRSPTTQSIEVHDTSPISSTHSPTLQSKSTEKYVEDKSTSPSSSKTSTDFMTTTPSSSSTSTVSSISTELTTASPVDHRTVQPSLSTEKETTVMVDITSDDEDIIFSGDYEPSTKNNELPSATTKTETTTKILDDVTSQTTKYDQTSKAVSDKFNNITSSVSDVAATTSSTPIYTSKQTPEKSTEKTTTSKGVTDGKALLITDDEDLTFSGDGDVVIDDDFVFNNDSDGNKDVPQALLKQITTEMIKDDHSTIKLLDKLSTTSSDKDVTAKDDAGLSTLKQVTEKLTTLVLDPETNQIIAEDKDSPNVPGKVTVGIKEDVKNVQTSDFTSDSPLISLIISTPMQTNKDDKSAKTTAIVTKGSEDISSPLYDYSSTTLNAKNAIKDTGTSTSNDIIITVSPDRLTSRVTIAKDKGITVDDKVLTPLLESQSPSDKVFIIDRLLGTIRKLPSVPEKARNSGDNFSFSSFLGFLDKISDLLGKLNDTTLNELNDQKSTTAREKESITEKNHIRHIVEVEN